jgi:hypothetical protein
VTPCSSVGGRQPLGHRHDVGVGAETLRAERVPEPAEAADDLVGDEQRPAAVGDLPQALPVAVGRHEAAAGVLHGLGDDDAHVLGPRLGDGALDVRERVVDLRPVRVRRGRVVGLDRGRAERLLHTGHAGERQRPERDAVVGHPAGDGLRALVLAAREVHLPGDLPRRLDGLRAAAGEERAAQARQLPQALGERERRRVRDAPVRRERQGRELLRRDGRDALAVRVAELGAEEARERVDVAPARRVEDVRALAAVEDDRLGAAVAREVQEERAIRRAHDQRDVTTFVRV